MSVVLVAASGVGRTTAATVTVQGDRLEATMTAAVVPGGTAADRGLARMDRANRGRLAALLRSPSIVATALATASTIASRIALDAVPARRRL